MELISSSSLEETCKSTTLTQEQSRESSSLNLNPNPSSVIVLGLATKGYEKTTVDHLLQLTASGILKAFITTGGSLIPYCRNKVIQQIYKLEPEFTHALLIDDDMTAFDRTTVEQLLEADKDIITPLMTTRSWPPKLVYDPVDYEDIKNKRIVDADHTGTAFMLIKRHVLDELMMPAPAGPLWFTLDREPRVGFNEEIEEKLEEYNRLQCRNEPGFNERIKSYLLSLIALGRYAHLGSDLLGEDIGFCHRAKDAGFDVCVHTGLYVGHVGSRVYTPFDHMKSIRMQYEGKELSEVEQMCTKI